MLTHMVKVNLLIALLFLTVSCAALSGSGGLAPDVKRDILKTKLPNGLTVILEEDHSAPVAAFQMWVRVGGADETDSEAGIAHVFEHMLFKGTEKRGVGEIAREIEGGGGYINAYTSYDNTVYHLAVASRNFSVGLDVMSDAIQNSAFDPEELRKELEVVIEEIRMNQDKPGRQLFMNLLSNSFTTHPYRRPVIGSVETVSSLTREYILDFFKRWYVPSNMTLVVVGDFDNEAALEEIKDSFRDFAAAPDPHSPRPVEPPQDVTRGAVISYDTVETHLGMVFHIPELKHSDTYAVDIAAAILGQGAGSRLYKRLKIDSDLVHSISTYAMTPKEPGSFFITATLKAENTDATVKAVREEVRRFSLEGPDAGELDRTKVGFESSFIYSRETMQGKANQLGYYETISGDLAFEKKYVEGIRGVTIDDVREVTARYLRGSNMAIVAIVPEKDEGLFTAGTLTALVAASEEAAADAAVVSTKPSPSDSSSTNDDGLTRVELPGGITLIVKEVHTNATFAVSAAFPGGLRFETPETNGIGSFVATMLKRGTKNRTRDDLVKEEEAMAGGVGAHSGRNSAGVSGKFLSRFFDEGLDIFADVVMNPTFPAEEIERVRKDTVASIKSQEDYMPGYTFKLLYKELYGDHPYAMHTSGTIKTVESFTREDLVAYYERVYVPERMVLTVVGDVDTAKVIKKVKSLFRDFSGLPSPMPVLEARTTVGKVIKTGAVKDKAQTNVGIGFMGPIIGTDDSYALSVLSEVLSSMGGRLFVELRDKRSLAYSVSAFSRPGVEPGIFAAYVGCAPDKTEEAIAGIFAELRKVTEEKVTEEELRIAKNAMIGGFDIGFQQVSRQASNITTSELFGLGHDNYKRYAAKVEAVTAEQILEAARKYIDFDSYVISIVGKEVVDGSGG